MEYVTPLQYISHWESLGKVILTNDGQTAMLTLSGCRSCRPVLVGGLLDGIFLFEQLHFHWGPNDSMGSEHVIDGKRYSMEAHLVYFNGRYRSFCDALYKQDGLVVVAVLLRASESFNDWNPLVPIVDALERIHNPYAKTAIPGDCLNGLRGLQIDRHYYTYHGSMTTTPYSENVRWLVYDTPVTVSSRQTAAFRELLQKTSTEKLIPITSNFRPLQSNVADDLVYVRDNANSFQRSKL
uniref:Carbonic anhydrase n=1 Tax=Anopheles farauti TaxID=69004 RepID=A0A182Q8E8_9DIPT